MSRRCMGSFLLGSMGWRLNHRSHRHTRAWAIAHEELSPALRNVLGVLYEVPIHLVNNPCVSAKVGAL